MTSGGSTRTRLPARVYWFRRALVLGTALALVFAVVHLATGSGSGPTGDPVGPGLGAEVVSGRTTPSPEPVDPAPLGPSATKTGSSKSGSATSDQVPSSGPCSIDDITVTPVRATSRAGSTIPVGLRLTGIRPACTFTVAPSTLAVKITKGDRRLWSSQDCPSAVQRRQVVVRSSAPTTVQVRWSGRTSTGSCSRSNAWVAPGKYRVTAAAIGSEPAQALITLVQPPRPVVIKTIKPKPKKKNVGVSPVTGKKSD